MTQPEMSNPYVGPRPFSMRDRGLFFGREREARDLIPLVISERLVLFYAQSGAGKSSLINARLVPGLVDRNFIVLPVARVSGQIAGDLPVDNIYVYNLLVSLERSAEQTPETHQRLAGMTLAEYLANMELEAAPALEADGAGTDMPQLPVDAPQTIGGVRPLALIIDQFEEIFTTHPEAWEQRGPFFEQLCQAMEADPYLWVVLSIREDYVAALTPYAYLLPGNLRARYYMQRMGYDAALEAVKMPVAGIRPFEAGAAEQLVNNLRLISAGESQNGQTVYIEGQYVEPVQLQVVCYQLWENLRDAPGSQITAADLNRLARGDDLAQFVSRALAEFYEQALANVLNDPSVTLSERRLRDWFSYELITEAETRGSVFQGESTTGQLPNEIVRLLEAQFIVRSETRAAGKWYELSHDRFIGPILQANRTWLEQNPRPILADAEAWNEAGQPSNCLYEGRQLEAAIKLLEEDPDSFDDLERDFIRESQLAADRLRSRRQRVGIALMALLLVVFTGLTIASLIGWDKAQQNQATAEAASTIASEQKVTADAARVLEAAQARTAEAASVIADQQRAEAEYQRQTAVAYSKELALQEAAANDARATAEMASTMAVEERDQAQIARDEAQVARNQAQAGRLSSLSDYFRNNNLDLSLLLAVEAVDLSDYWDTLSALFDSVQRGLDHRVSRDGASVRFTQKPNAVAFSPDGSLVAGGLFDGSVELIYTDSRGRVGQIPSGFKANFPVYAVAFSPDGATLAQGNGSGQVLLWNRESGEVKTFYPFRNTFPFVLALTFQPGGDLLALGTQIEQVSGLGNVILYNYKEDRVERTWNCGPYDCTALAWSPDGQKLAVANKGGSVKVLELDRGREGMSVDKAHNDHVYGLAWYPDNQRLVSAGLDRRILQWDTRTNQVTAESDQLLTPVVRSLAISPDGRFLLVGHSGTQEDIWASLWDSETLVRLDYQLYQHSQPVSAVAFDAQGNRFATASYDNSLVLWNFDPVNPLSHLIVSIPQGRLEAINQDSNGELVFVQNASSGQINIINQRVEQSREISGGQSSLAAFTEAGKSLLALGDYNGQVTLVDAETGAPLGLSYKIANGSLRSLAVSQDGQLIAGAACRSANQCDQIAIYDRQARELLEMKGDLNRLGLGLVTALAFDSTNQILGIGTGEGQILFYNIATGAVDQAVTEGLNLKNVALVVTSLAFGPPESDLLVAGFHNGRVALWQASTRGPIGQFAESASGEVSALFFRRDAQSGLLKLVAATNRGEVREYEVDVQAWQQRACELVGNRDMTLDEKSKFRIDGDLERVTCPRQP